MILDVIRALWNFFLILFSSDIQIYPLRSGRHLQSTNQTLPNESVLIKVGETVDQSTTALFFHIPKAGGTTVQDLTARCLDLIAASEVGIGDGHDKDTLLRIVTLEDGSKFVNVDATTLEGLDRAHHLGFQRLKPAQIVFTGFLPQATTRLFDTNNRASIFSIFRHPTERAMSMFYYLQDAAWEPTYQSKFKDMTFLGYLKSEYLERDWIVRNLVGKYTEPLEESDLDFSKYLVTNYFWVGIISKMEESIDRFGSVFGWKQKHNWLSCFQNFVNYGSNIHTHPEIHLGREEIEILEQANFYDLQLYVHALKVFEAQSQYFKDGDEA
jgi:hypothetical protein